MNRIKKRPSIYLAYTAVFLLLALLVFGRFALAGRTFIWKEDGYNQHFKALIYYSRWLKSYGRQILTQGIFSVPAFSLSLGYGSDLISTLHYYVIGDPLNLLSVLVPERFMAHFYDACILVRFWLSGMAFLAFYRYTHPAGYQKMAALAGSLVYVFSGYALIGGLRHPYFLDPMICFPLLLLGLERAIREKKRLGFTLTVFLSAVCNIYFFYMLAVLTVLYYLWRCLPLRSRKARLTCARETAILFLHSLLGTLMASLILVPVLLAFLTDSRSGSDYSFRFLYDLNYYRTLLNGFLSIRTNSDQWTYQGYGVLALPAVYTLFTSRRRHGKLRIAFVVLSLFLLLPVFGYALNAFTYVLNRWIWAYSLLMAMIIADCWKEITELSRRRLMGLAAFCALYFGVCVLLDYSLTLASSIQLILVFGLLFYLLAVCTAPASDKTSDPTAAARQFRVTERLMLGLVVLSVAVNACCTYSFRENELIEEFTDLGQTADRSDVLESLTAAEELAAASDGSSSDVPDAAEGEDSSAEPVVDNSYKVDAIRSNLWLTDASAVLAFLGTFDDTQNPLIRYSGKDLELNASLLSGISSTQYYWSLSNPYVNEFMTAMAVSDSKNYYDWYQGLDDRTMLNALAGVNYYTTDDSNYLPYGYPYSADGGKISELYPVYHNSLSLPFGYTYDKLLSYNDFQTLSPIDRQEALMQAALADASRDELGDLPYAAYDTLISSSENRKWSLSCDSADVTIGEDKASFVVTAPDASVTIEFHGKVSSETYLYLEGLNYEPTSISGLYKDNKAVDPNGLYDTDRLALMDGLEVQKLKRSAVYWTAPKSLSLGITFLKKDKKVTEKSIMYYTSESQWGKQQQTFLVNSCYNRSRKINQIRITFPKAGIYSITDLKVLQQPVNSFLGFRKKLSADAMEHVDLHTDANGLTNHITGDISLDQGKLLCMTIPYSHGWTAYVDGQKASLIRTNIMFCGLALEAGDHTIELRYETPGLRAGMWVSVCALVLIVLLVTIESVLRNNPRRKNTKKH